MDVWQEVVKILGTVAIVMAALGWLARSLATHFLSRDIEQYKSHLYADTTRAVETLKADLQLAAKEHQIRFNTLHEKRVEVLADLYGRLWQLFQMMQQLAAMDDDAAIGSKAREAIATLDDIFLQFKRQRLYVNRDIALQVDVVLLNVHSALVSFRPEFKGQPNPGWLVHRSRLLTEHGEDSDLSRILFRLEELFRSLLGGELEARSPGSTQREG
jgi:hypothetical protein